MVDEFQIIQNVFEYMNSISFSSGHRFVELDDMDYNLFKSQDSDIDGIGVEFVRQSGGGLSGDDFYGTMGFPVGGKMLLIDYHT